MLYDEELTEQRKPENAYSTKIETAFDKAKAYDDMRDCLYGIRLMAWAKHKDDNAHSVDKMNNHIADLTALSVLTNDHELLAVLMQSPLD